MRRVLDVLLSADPRLTAYIKYGSLNVGFEGDLAAFVQSSKKQVNLMFGRGARIKGDFPHLEGTGPSARFMRFADVAEVDGRAKELAAGASAWVALVEQNRAEVGSQPVELALGPDSPSARGAGRVPA